MTFLGVYCHLDFGVSEAAGDFLDVDAFIGEQTGVAVPEVVDANAGEAGEIGVGVVMVRDSGVADAVRAAADAPVIRKRGESFMVSVVLVEKITEAPGIWMSR